MIYIKKYVIFMSNKFNFPFCTKPTIIFTLFYIQIIYKTHVLLAFIYIYVVNTTQFYHISAGMSTTQANKSPDPSKARAGGLVV